MQRGFAGGRWKATHALPRVLTNDGPGHGKCGDDRGGGISEARTRGVRGMGFEGTSESGAGLIP